MPSLRLPSPFAFREKLARRFGGLVEVAGRWPIACAVAVFCLLMAQIVGRLGSGALTVEDDANYYLVIARNIAATGVSTFDHQSLTNGYHPLWLGLLVLQDLTTGPSLFVTLSLQALLLAVAAYLFLRAATNASALLQVAFTLCFVGTIGHFALDGMETALLVFCVGLFVAIMDWAGAGDDRRGLALGLAAAACIGARIDAAFFIAPALAFAPVSLRRRTLAFAILAVLGGAYAAYNLATFGMVLPVSSAIKSLGGLQINHRVLAQLGFGHGPRKHYGLYLLTGLALIASPALIALSKPGTKARALALAASLGGFVYMAKILLLSSWEIWPWYNFALLFPLTTALIAAPTKLAPFSPRLDARFGAGQMRLAVLAGSVAGLMVIGVCAMIALAFPPRLRNSFASINHLTLQQYGSALGGARVAMGDRAGSFAMEYTGSVVQLEGLVNDKAYLKMLTQGGDARALLCGRGVRFVAAYEPDLGAYQHFRFAVLRPALTQFNAPSLDVWRSDEVGKVVSLDLYDNRLDLGAGDNTFYLWRLRCDGPSSNIVVDEPSPRLKPV